MICQVNEILIFSVVGPCLCSSLEMYRVKVLVALLIYNVQSFPQSLHHTVGGHSSVVTRVDFLADDSRLVSAGGRDTAIMQWALQ